MYSMPVVGTSVRLYFPDESGNEPLVSGCVRSNGSSCAKTSDTTKRYFGTEHGSELEMTPSAINIKGGSASPISISIDDNVGIKITSPKKLTLGADSEIIMKTPKNVKINGVSQINALKSNTQSGFSLETDLHFLSNNVISDGKSSESYPDFEDEPQAGEMPKKEPPKEEKKGFNWGKLACNVLAGLAVVAAVTVTAVAVAATLGAAAVVVGAIGVGAAVAGTAFKEAAPFVKKAANKVSSKISEDISIAKLAMKNLEKQPKRVVLGSNLGNVDEAARRFAKEFKKVKNEIKLEPKRMDAVIEVPEFNVKPKFNKDIDLKNEYTRQVKGQEEGLNKLTIKDYLDNREAYANRLKEQKQAGKKNPSGRDPKGAAQQQRIREEALKNKIKEYKKQGLKPEDAKEKANKWMKTQAALHDPDQIAGGNPQNVTGMGDKRINSSIGSQWKSRADDIEKQVRKYIEDNSLSEKDLEKIYLNIKLSCGGK